MTSSRTARVRHALPALALATACAAPAAPQAASPKTAAPAQSAPPASAKASPAETAPKAPAAAPARVADPRVEAFLAWAEGIFAWGAGETTADEIPQANLKGWRLLKVQKSFAFDSRFNDQVYVAVDDSGRNAVIGELFADEARMKAPAPVRSDADLAGLREQLARFLRGKPGLVLLPSADRPGWKGVKLTLATGYGDYEMNGYLSADTGAILLLGRVWDRKRSIAEQRRELIKLAGTPSTGPADAAVTVVEYSDMQCPFCRKRAGDWEPLVDKLAKELKIRRYFKSFPLVNDHPWAFRASSAGSCFFEKDPALYFRWKSNVYARQDQLTVADVDAFALDFASASDLGEQAFRACYLQDRTNKKILSDLSEGFSIRVRSTPSYFVDGVLVSWYTDNLMEEYLRKTYLKGAGLPLPTPKPPASPAAAPAKKP
ncbi:DsbA family protein [Acidobacteria bacterium ACD]|nr:MAG: DsbA family protein [Acidobacteriota bacterium]MDL1950564.1 DsbA family protein [Acidobacteria bacterium ACD]